MTIFSSQKRHLFMSSSSCARHSWDTMFATHHQNAALTPTRSSCSRSQKALRRKTLLLPTRRPTSSRVDAVVATFGASSSFFVVVAFVVFPPLLRVSLFVLGKHRSIPDDVCLESTNNNLLCDICAKCFSERRRQSGTPFLSAGR